MLDNDQIFNRKELLESLDDDDDSIIPELIDAYLQDSRTRLEQLKSAVAAGDYDAIRSSAHALKGSSSYLYASRVREASARLEQEAKLKSLPLESCAAMLDEVEAAFDEFVQYIGKENT